MISIGIEVPVCITYRSDITLGLVIFSRPYLVQSRYWYSVASVVGFK